MFLKSYLCTSLCFPPVAYYFQLCIWWWCVSSSVFVWSCHFRFSFGLFVRRVYGILSVSSLVCLLFVFFVCHTVCPCCLLYGVKLELSYTVLSFCTFLGSCSSSVSFPIIVGLRHLKILLRYIVFVIVNYIVVVVPVSFIPFFANLKILWRWWQSGHGPGVALAHGLLLDLVE